MSELALKLIRQAKAEDWTELDLGRTGLTKLPEELFELEQLEKLIISNEYWNLEKNKFIESPNQSYKNCLSGSLPQDFRKLQNLRELYIGGGNSKWDIDNINILSQLPLLTHLDISRNQLKDISALKDHTSLNSIDIGSNQLISDFSILCHLNQLEHLKIDSNLIKDINFLRHLALLQSLNLSANHFKDLTPLENLKALQNLNINSNNVDNISILSNLNSLKILNLSGNRHINDYNILENLHDLESLALYSNQLTEIDFLKNLTKLRILDLSTNQITDVSVLENLQNLSNLSLRGNLIRDISILEKLFNLRHLSIPNNRVFNIDILKELNQLITLDLGNNQINDINVLSNLLELKVLLLNNNKIEEIAPLSKLKKLELLILSNNKINNISPLSKLYELTYLSLNHNQIKDIHFLENLNNLRTVYLGDNQIKDIKVLIKLNKLQMIGLNNNQISNIEAIKDLIHLPNLHTLYLFGNPIVDIPAELLGNLEAYDCLVNLQDYFKDIDQSSKKNREIKMILVGNGCVGKTTLTERLVHNPPAPIYKDIETERTHGITIQPWALADMNTKVNVWDFGGQEIYHATHRMFLSRRTLYLLVWAKETEEQLDQPRYEPTYWLDYIADLGRDSRVIIVQNMSDLHGILSLPNESALKEDYANTFQLKFGNSISVSAQTGKSTSTLIAEIKENMKEILQEYSELLPESWAIVRNRIEADRVRGVRTLTKSVYHQYCTEAGISGTSPKTLLDYLHSVGAVYYQQGLFNDEIIVDQVWAPEGVYAILKSETIKNSTLDHGYFTLADARRIWSAEQYSDEEIQVFIRFMLSCKIAFQHDVDNKTRYIVPWLLKEDTRLELAWTNRLDALHVRLDYLHLHRSIIERFIVRTAQLSADTYDIWRNAIALDLEGGDALITANVESKSIFIRTAGQNKAGLLAKIIKEFEDIRHFKDRVQQFVSLDGKLWLPKVMLEQKRNEGKATFYHDDKEYSVQSYQPFFVHLEKDEELVPLHNRHDPELLDGEYQKGSQNELLALIKKLNFYKEEYPKLSDVEQKFSLKIKIEELEKEIEEKRNRLE